MPGHAATEMLRKATTDELDLIHGWISEHPLRLFGDLRRKSLLRILRNRRLVDLIEVTCIVYEYNDSDAHIELRRSVLRLLKRDGVALPRGKKTRPELKSMVEDLAAIMWAEGVPLATGEGSVMIRALVEVHEELQMKGDPRNELRRLVRERRLIQARAREAILEALSRGLQRAFGVNQLNPQQLSTPPIDQ